MFVCCVVRLAIKHITSLFKPLRDTRKCISMENLLVLTLFLPFLPLIVPNLCSRTMPAFRGNSSPALAPLTMANNCDSGIEIGPKEIFMFISHIFIIPTQSASMQAFLPPFLCLSAFASLFAPRTKGFSGKSFNMLRQQGIHYVFMRGLGISLGELYSVCMLN